VLGDGRTRLLYQALVAVPLLGQHCRGRHRRQPLAALGLIAALLLVSRSAASAVARPA